MGWLTHTMDLKGEEGTERVEAIFLKENVFLLFLEMFERFPVWEH